MVLGPECRFFWKLLNGTVEDVAAESPPMKGEQVGSMVAGGVSFIAMETGDWSRASAKQAEEQLDRGS
jgi:hypothetical protein